MFYRVPPVCCAVSFRDWSLILPGEEVKDVWEGGQNSTHSDGGGDEKLRAPQEDYGVSSEILE